jgi:exopolysaccharide biosynthesis WecB/TagA/CpsF family protein
MSEPNARRQEFHVDGIRINIRSQRQAATAVVNSVQRARGACLFTLNLDHCVKLRAIPEFKQAYQQADFVSADGFPIVLLGRMSGLPLRRTAGADLVVPICRMAALNHLPVFLLGPTADVLRHSRAQLLEHIDGLHIAGTYAPGANFDPESVDADIAIERIRQSGARICFLAIGAPRQEIFAARCHDRLPGIALICVGAALDFIAGSQHRAPHFMRRNGMEWLWRLSTNPRRLGLRYLKCAAAMPRLLADAVPQAVSARMGRH